MLNIRYICVSKHTKLHEYNFFLSQDNVKHISSYCTCKNIMGKTATERAKDFLFLKEKKRKKSFFR